METLQIPFGSTPHDSSRVLLFLIQSKHLKESSNYATMMSLRYSNHVRLSRFSEIFIAEPRAKLPWSGSEAIDEAQLHLIFHFVTTHWILYRVGSKIWCFTYSYFENSWLDLIDRDLWKSCHRQARNQTGNRKIGIIKFYSLFRQDHRIWIKSLKEMLSRINNKRML